MNRFVLLGLLIFVSVAQATPIYSEQVYPKAEEGYKKRVISVPHSNLDHTKKLEIRVGKWLETDSCNLYTLLGQLEQKNLTGWGRHYYVLHTNGQVASTKALCQSAKKQERFVSLPPIIEDYNGLAPIVFYVPKEYEVQFKIYQAQPDTYQAREAID